MLSCQTSYISSFDGEKLYSVEQGTLAGYTETFVLLNGLGGGVTSWVFIIARILELHPTARCIVYDTRGHSLSTHQFPKAESDFLTVLARDLAVVCEYYHCQHPILVGHSLGGMVIQRYLYSHPDFVPKSIVLLSTPFFTKILPHAIGSSAYKLLAYLTAHTTKEYVPMSVFDHEKFKDTFELYVPRIFKDIQTTGLLPFLLYWTCVLASNPIPLTAFAHKKLMFVFGKRDFVLPPRSQLKIKQLFTDASCRDINTNHNTVVNAPDAVAAAISQAASLISA